MADITIADVTTTLPTGDGVFDVLMRSIDLHLDKQYTYGRIKGADYATVYLGALQAVLQQSIAFVLAEQKAEKEIDLLTKQIDLASQQLLTEIENTRLINANADAKEYEVSYLLPEHRTKLQEEVDILQSQDIEIIASTIRQDNIAAEQIAASQANTALKQQLGGAQEAVYNRQATGFDDDYKTKIFSTLMGLRTTGMTQEMAGLVNGTSTNSGNALVNELIKDSGIDPTGTAISNILADIV